ncbi:MAG: membrane protein insertase YidC [Akkermansia sp.]|nr:membrane protein insertase YidC [Akkermansia sp.]
MDKTSIIVVGSCIALLGVNWWYTSNQTPPPAPAPQAQTAPATPIAEQPAAPQQATTPATPAYATPAVPVPQTIATLTSHDAAGKPVARYTIQDIGGSVKCVDMLGQAINSTKEELRGDVSINGNVPQGIGTLMFRLSNDAAPAFDQTTYSVIPDLTNDKQVAIIARMGDLMVRKIYALAPLQQGDKTLDGNAYVLNLTVDVQNVGGVPLTAANWGLYAGGMSQINHAEGSIYTHYIRLENGDFEKENRGSFDPFFGSAKSRIYTTGCKDLKWVGTMSQYYSTVVMPSANSGNNAWYAAPTRYKLPVTNEEVDGVEVAAGVPDFTLSPKTADMPGGVRSLSYKIFTGPKLNLMLEDMTHDIPRIEQIMDYGWLYLISYPMNWLINIFHDWFGNWGWAIVAMTFVVRLIIWPLYRKSYTSMKRMSLLQPMMKELKEKYPNDQQKVSMEMMNLYRQYGISPFGGCLPMFLQIPIFFAFFYVLQTAAELRGAPFLGWVTDLSQMDTVYTLPFTIMGWEPAINVLPFVMAASMIFMMKMTPQAGDPTQQKIMKFMPVMFFLFCYTYPSALALYWTTTNIISIIQTLIIRRLPQPTLEKVDPKKRKQPKKGGFLDRMQRMMEEQQKALEEQKRQANMRNVTKK